MKKFLFVFIFAHILLWFGVSAVIFTWDVVFIAHANRTTGIVIGIKERNNNDGQLFCPIVEYVDDTGKQRTFSPNSWEYPLSYEKGDSVPVAYYRDQSVIYDFSFFWLLPLVFFILGLISVLILAIMVYAERSGLVRRFFPDRSCQR